MKKQTIRAEDLIKHETSATIASGYTTDADGKEDGYKSISLKTVLDKQTVIGVIQPRSFFVVKVDRRHKGGFDHHTSSLQTAIDDYNRE